jgi:hypothetical protein
MELKSVKGGRWSTHTRSQLEGNHVIPVPANGLGQLQRRIHEWIRIGWCFRIVRHDKCQVHIVLEQVCLIRYVQLGTIEAFYLRAHAHISDEPTSAELSNGCPVCQLRRVCANAHSVLRPGPEFAAERKS